MFPTGKVPFAVVLAVACSSNSYGMYLVSLHLFLFLVFVALFYYVDGFICFHIDTFFRAFDGGRLSI